MIHMTHGSGKDSLHKPGTRCRAWSAHDFAPTHAQNAHGKRPATPGTRSATHRYQIVYDAVEELSSLLKDQNRPKFVNYLLSKIGV